MRVLVVEDEHRVASYICKALIEESFAVDLAHDGLRALELTAEHQHDAIVLDLMLPGLDGIAVCRRVRQAHANTRSSFSPRATWSRTASGGWTLERTIIW